MADPSRLLVVDDVPENVRLMDAVLTAQGYEVVSASSGAEALEAIAHRAPDLVLLDIQMPGLNGYEVCRRIRAMPRHARSLIVALTGWGQEDDRERSRLAGFDHHLVKPADLGQLRSLLGEPTARFAPPARS